MKNYNIKREWLKKVQDVSKEYAIDKYKNCIPEHTIINGFINFCIEQDCFGDFPVHSVQTDNGLDIILEWRATDLHSFDVNIELIEWLNSKTQKAMVAELVSIYKRLFYKIALLYNMSEVYKSVTEAK